MTNNLDKESFDSKNNNQYLLDDRDDVNLKDDYPNTKINVDNLTLIRSCKKKSIAYIVLWSILFVFVIFATPFTFNPFNELLFDSLLILGPIFGFILFVLGIILINQTLSLKRYYCNHVLEGLFIWFWVGLYLFGIFSFIGSFLTLNNCNKIKKLNHLEAINKSEYLNTSVENKKDNLFLLKMCRWVSFFYILLWVSLIIFIIFASIAIQESEQDFYNHMHAGSQLQLSVQLSFDSMGIGCGCFGFFLFFLSIFLAGVNISLSNFYYSGFKTSFNLFIIGSFFCGITSFFGSINAIHQCNKIIKPHKSNWRSKLNLEGGKLVEKSKKSDDISSNVNDVSSVELLRKSKKVSIAFLVVGSAFTITGVGLVGGTYGSFNNYQLLSSMQNTITKDNLLSSIGYNLNSNNQLYFNQLQGSSYSFGSFLDDSGNTITIYGLDDFFNRNYYYSCYDSTFNDYFHDYYNLTEIILYWLSNSWNKNGIIDYLSSINQTSLSSDDVNSLNQAIENLKNLESDISNGFPNSSDILNVLDGIDNTYNNSQSIQKDDSIAQKLANALSSYNGTSGLLNTISTIDSDFTQLINDKVIDLSDSSSMNSTTKQYFENYISLLGTNSATLIGVNPSPFVAMFDTNQAITAFSNNNAIGLNSLSLYLQTDSSQTFFETSFALYQFAINSLDNTYIGFSMDQISPDGWNKNIADLSDFQKANLNDILQSQKNIFYKQYPTWDGTWKNTANNANLTDQEAKDIYYLQDSIYHLNCNYDADQSGVIAGSVLLAFGLIAVVISVISLSRVIKKEKKEAK